MKIVHLACGVSAAVWLVACAAQRTQEVSAPAASSSSADLATAPAAQEEAAPAPESPPAPAAAPPGLEDRAQKFKAPAEEEFTNLAAAERALNQAKSDLDRLALAEPSPVVGRNAATERPAEKKDAKAAQPPSAAGAAASSAPNPCENACRAFSSLSRAANAVCRLDGSSGTHCTHAKRVVADSQHRVASCTCPATGD